MQFLNAHPALQSALAARNYDTPTDVQRAVLEADADGRDLLVSAQTGSGKTVAFGLAIAPTLLGETDTLPPAGLPLALVIAPTRELALQVREELNWLYAPTAARIVTCVGGMDPKLERQLLARGCHIVVGTPGRLRDHLERGQLDVAALRCVVLDEADEMLDLGFREDLEFILRTTPAARRTLLFSATIAKEIASLARSFQRDALRIDTVNRREPHTDIEYRALKLAPGEIEHATVNVLRYYEPPGALVFCGTRDGVRHMHASLQERGFAAVALSGELSQAERTRALKALRDGRARVCIATDVAARGLDLPSLDLVIHADLPGSREALLHRSGRTGRAGRKGTCVVLVPSDRQRRAGFLFASANINAVWGDVPRAEEIRARDEARLLENPLFSEIASPDELAAGRRLLEQRPAEELAAVLLRLLRSRLPEPEELSDVASRPARPVSRGPDGAMVAFKVRLGRQHKADPKWLLPLICRLGGVTKQEVGRIRIADDETVFEVTAAAADQFLATARKAGPHEARIEPVSGADEQRSRPRGPGPKPSRGEKPRGYKARSKLKAG